ncbi:MAG: host-nuclease inhibitor Gam family protein [Bacteroidota bacterium]
MLDKTTPIKDHLEAWNEADLALKSYEKQRKEQEERLKRELEDKLDLFDAMTLPKRRELEQQREKAATEIEIYFQKNREDLLDGKNKSFKPLEGFHVGTKQIKAKVTTNSKLDGLQELYKALKKHSELGESFRSKIEVDKTKMVTFFTDLNEELVKELKTARIEYVAHGEEFFVKFTPLKPKK